MYQERKQVFKVHFHLQLVGLATIAGGILALAGRKLIDTFFDKVETALTKLPQELQLIPMKIVSEYILFGVTMSVIMVFVPLVYVFITLCFYGKTYEEN